MRTDYFDDLLPDFVTIVARNKPVLVTPENSKYPCNNSRLDEALPALPVLPAKTGNTEQKTEHSTERYAYHFRLVGNEGGGTVLTDEPTLDKARASLAERYGDRLALVVKA